MTINETNQMRTKMKNMTNSCTKNLISNGTDIPKFVPTHHLLTPVSM